MVGMRDLCVVRQRGSHILTPFDFDGNELHFPVRSDRFLFFEYDMKRPLILLCLASLSACQSLEQHADQPLQEVFAIYANRADALAIAKGQFGAVPIALPSARQFASTTSKDCQAEVSEVELSSGERGWIPTMALPTEIKAKLGCSGLGIIDASE